MIKIAIPTNDRSHIAELMGKATFFAVATIDEGNMTHLEFRSNPLHEQGTDGKHNHTAAVEAIDDCSIVLVRKIGKNLHADLHGHHKEIVITGSASIGEGVKRYLSQAD